MSLTLSPEQARKVNDFLDTYVDEVLAGKIKYNLSTYGLYDKSQRTLNRRFDSWDIATNKMGVLMSIIMLFPWARTKDKTYSWGTIHGSRIWGELPPQYKRKTPPTTLQVRKITL